MRSVALLGAVGALILGLTTGLALRPHDGDADSNDKGPQQVFSTAHGDASKQDGEGWWSVRAGPVGDWVYGSDWVHPKDAVAVFETAFVENDAGGSGSDAPAPARRLCPAG